MGIIVCKDFSEMTLPELREEHARWVKATARGGWAYFYGKAHDTRDELAGWIAHREREAGAAA